MMNEKFECSIREERKKIAIWLVKYRIIHHRQSQHPPQNALNK